MKTRTEIQPKVNIESVIRTVRGEKVLLDNDLALIYGVPTRVLTHILAIIWVSFCHGNDWLSAIFAWFCCCEAAENSEGWSR